MTRESSASSPSTSTSTAARDELARWFTKIRTRAPTLPPPAERFERDADAGSRAPSRAVAAKRALDALGASLRITSRTKAHENAHEGDDEASHALVPEVGDEIIYHCVARTKDFELYSTRTRGVPRRTVLANDACDVTRALEVMLAAMSVGERWEARAAWSATYGDATAETRALDVDERLNPGDIIIYDVEVLAHNPVSVVRLREEKDGESKKVRLKNGGWARCTKTPTHPGVGWETPRPPFEVTIEYSAYVVHARKSAENNEIVDDKELIERTEVTFVVGDGRTPLALDAATRTMRLNEEALIWTNYGGFGTNASLMSKYSRLVPALPSDGSDAADGVVYKLKLVSMRHVRDVFNDGSTTKTRVELGQGEFPADCPMQDCTVRVHFTLSTATTSGVRTDLAVKYDTRTDVALKGEPYTFRLGCGAVPEALETSIRLMIPKERARVVLDLTLGEKSRRHGYGAKNCRADAPGAEYCAVDNALATVQWDVVLESFDAAVNWYKADVQDMLNEALVIKEEANALFKTQVYELARSKYEKTLSKLESLRGLDEDDFEAVDAMKMTLGLNLVASLQRLNDHVSALARVNKILESHPDNAKALFRRSVSLLAQHEFDAARDDLFACVDADPSSQSSIAKQLDLVKRAEAAAAAQAKAAFGGKL